MRERLSVKKLVVATYPQYIPASGDGAHTKPERRALVSRRGCPCQASQAPASAVRDHGRLGLGRRLHQLQWLRVPSWALGPSHEDCPRAQGLSWRDLGGVDGALLGWPRRGYPRRAVLVPHAVVRRERFG